MTARTIAELIAEEKCREAEVLSAVRAGVRQADPLLLIEAFDQLDSVFDGWPKAMRSIVRLGANPPKRFREKMLLVWATGGDHMRCETGNDLLLIDALRELLPVYQGPPLRVWRGDGAWNRRRRTYGLSWSRHLEVADAFARGLWRTCQGGSVVLETDAPSEAVICAVEGSSHDGEEEILIDRRRLSDVRAITRYEQKALTASHETP